MPISATGLKLIEEFEGYRSVRYLDSVGVPTIGYGTTASVVDPVPETCTEAQAAGWLELYINKAVEPALQAAIAVIPADKPKPNQNQTDALRSAAYNLGAGIFEESWQIGKDLRAGDLEAVSGDFLRYVYAGGSVLEGLVNRRKAEQKLFNTPYVAPVPPYSYDWFDEELRSILGGEYTDSELLVAKAYDHLRPVEALNPVKINRLRHMAGALADRLDAIMEVDPQHNDEDHREWRKDQLTLRSQGLVVVK